MANVSCKNNPLDTNTNNYKNVNFVKSFKQNILLRVAAIVAILLLSVTATQGDDTENGLQNNRTLKILTIGNSFANNACSFLPQITESVPGYRIEITKANIGGCSFEKHATLIKECENNPALKPYSKNYCLKELLQMDNYDFVTIQQVSSSSFRSETFQPYADILIKFIRKHSPHSTIIIHQTWAYNPNCKRLKNWSITRKEMHTGLVKNYNTLAKEYDLDILPVGEAFYNTYKKNKTINLWKEDMYHANENGCYLAGCVWFGRLFGISPKQIEFVPEEIELKTAKILRKMANREIKKQKL